MCMAPRTGAQFTAKSVISLFSSQSGNSGSQGQRSPFAKGHPLTGDEVGATKNIRAERPFYHTRR